MKKMASLIIMQLAFLSIELEQREQAFAYLEKAFGERRDNGYAEC